jgi:amino acid transporter
VLPLAAHWGRDRIGMSSRERLRRLLIGPPRNPLSHRTRERIVLVAFVAWVGLGADGLSSANYGPAEAYLALGRYAELGLFIALAIVVTVFVIALSYNQVIELFPSGGGGYKVATRLLGRYPGLVSGSALIVDYVLTIVISVAAGVDALFSLLPLGLHGIKLPAETLVIAILAWLNLRGVKESILVLMPIFIGFLITHLSLILIGILGHATGLPALIPHSMGAAARLTDEAGWLFVVSVLLRAYSFGAGTFTGIEAISNNCNVLAEPRVRTGKWAMMYLAISLAGVAGALMVLYLLWGVAPVAGQTLNAVVFDRVLTAIAPARWPLHHAVLLVVMAFAAALLFVAANTGFLGGPAVLANMALDRWVPTWMANLSTRLVTQNGILLMGGAAIVALWATHGSVDLLIILYSINVFITFSMSLLGLARHWWGHRHRAPDWLGHAALSAIGFVFAAGILAILIVEKFTAGAWITLLVTSAFIIGCVQVRRHYLWVERQLRAAETLLAVAPRRTKTTSLPPMDPTAPTAVFLIGESIATGLHALLWVNRMFPRHYRNVVFATVGEVDAESFGGEKSLAELRQEVQHRIDRCAEFCHARGIPTAAYQDFGTDVVAKLDALCGRIVKDFPTSVFFASKLVFDNDNWLIRLLHNQTALALQQQLHQRGVPMMILPMKLGGQTSAPALPPING